MTWHPRCDFSTVVILQMDLKPEWRQRSLRYWSIPTSCSEPKARRPAIPKRPFIEFPISNSHRDFHFLSGAAFRDEALLELAENKQLRNPRILREQVVRMLRDEKSRSLVDHFASQWLYLRNLANFTPDRRRYPDFDDNLRNAMRRETELCFARMLEEDLSVLTLIKSNTTFLNERLANHYGIRGVLGSHFRQVEVGSDSNRGGILRHASILAVTSYANRTSPTIRGNWILEKCVGDSSGSTASECSQPTRKIHESIDVHSRSTCATPRKSGLC